MSQVTLQLCRLREGRLAEDREAEPVTLDWNGLVKRLAPSGSRNAMLILRDLRIGEFVGTRRKQDGPQNFKITEPSGKIKQILKAQPTFGSDLIEVYRVVRSEWDSRILEPTR